MMNNYINNRRGGRTATFFIGVGILLFMSFAGISSALAQKPAIWDYTAYPPFIDQSVKPNIMIILDNSESMNKFAYEGTYNPNEEYYGYFGSNVTYDHGSQSWDPDPAGNGAWCGNFLNFLTMRRIDIVRKVIGGGNMRGRTGTGALELELAINEGGPSTARSITYDSTDNSVSEWDGNYKYEIDDKGDIKVSPIDNPDEEYERKRLRVQKDKDIDDEDDWIIDEDGDYRLGGVMQSFNEDAYWGNIWFHEGRSPAGRRGAYVNNPIDDYSNNWSSLINSLTGVDPDARTPLAAAYYVAMQHFKQEAVPSDLGYTAGAAEVGSNKDPFRPGRSEWCAKNFILVLTDGLSTKDTIIPSDLKNYAGKGASNDLSPSFFIDDEDGSGYTQTCGRWDSDAECLSNAGQGGTDFIKDIAYYARVWDLRDDVEGHTHLIPYIVHTFPEDNVNDFSRDLLREAARQGGWRRQINDNIPGLNSKNELTGDKTKDELIPNNYFEARTGRALEQALIRAIQAMLEDAASGTAASVVTPEGRGEGEGSVIQAHFEPLRVENEYEIDWPGYLNSLWIDQCGNLREDHNGSQKLDFENAPIIEYSYERGMGGTQFYRYDADFGDNEEDACPTPIKQSGPYELNELNSIFEAGKILWETDPGDRRIYTYTDKQVLFTKDNNDVFGDYLGVNDASVDLARYSMDHFGSPGLGQRQNRLIDYIRGEDHDDLRSRTLELEDSGENMVKNTWKLGNIVNSTPVSIAGAVGQYDLVYRDRSYRQFRAEQRDRETMVYVGSNAGMLHAFTHGKYDRDNKQFDPYTDSTYGELAVGTEVWAYIPRALLPHLKWLADPDYTHVFYADLQPKVFDAKIRGSDGDEWGTFLLLGLNKGGKSIYVYDDNDNIIGPDGDEIPFTPSYTLIDITDPREPEVMWERSYDGSGLTTSVPSIFRTDGNINDPSGSAEWYAAFGSGPNHASGKKDYDGYSDQKSTIFIIDLKTGDEKYTQELSAENAFLNSPTAFDKNINYNVDAIYFGESYLKDDIWKGNIHKINIVDVEEDENDLKTYSYGRSPENWDHSLLFESPGPVSAAVNMRTDPDDNVMIFFGTGRNMSQEDITYNEQQYLFGIKDPFYDDNNEWSHVAFGDLFKSNDLHVSDQGYVFEGDGSLLFRGHADGSTGGDGTFDEMVDYIRNHYQGWYRELRPANFYSAERIISRVSLLGGTLLVPTYIPHDDICEPLGFSNVLALYYQSGTGFKRHILSEDESPGSRDGQTLTAIRFKDTFTGAPASTLTFHSGTGRTRFGLLQLQTAQQVVFEFDPHLETSNVMGWRDR